MTKHEALKKYFGYDNFRTGQSATIEALLSRRDALAVMPTGAGKSLCFQVPALLLDGITIVISPLIALMRDQVGGLVQSAIPAAYINSSQQPHESQEIINNALNGSYKLLYVAPERLDSPYFLDFASRAHISMVAVDEAHCLSLWGQDFRPSYLGVSSFIERLPRRPIVSAFTATATEAVKSDIVSLLAMQDPYVQTTGFDRPNLRFEVRHPEDKRQELLSHIRANQGNGIVYCSTRNNVEEVAAFLRSQGVSAESYHAGLDQHERSRSQDNFVYDKTSVIVATNAFGMGIDKSNVSFVIHYNMPKNLEGYYQEAGRAGRDGSSAQCLLLFSKQDVIIQQRLIEYSSAQGTSLEDARTLISRDYMRLRKMEAYCYTSSCLRSFILEYFEDGDAPLEDGCGNCSACEAVPQKIDVTVDAQKILSCVYHMRSRFGISTISNTLRGINNANARKHRLDTIKTYGKLSSRSDREVVATIRYLLEQGYLQLHGNQYNLVDLTPKSKSILLGHTTLEMPITAPLTSAPTKKTPSKASTPINDALFNKLKALRTKLATKEGVPAYLIFSDATLRDMCVIKPTTPEGFLSVSGVGTIKLQKYGEAFLQVINE